jgi:ATP-dependent Lon protease
LSVKILKISKTGYQAIIRGYTREAGVRNLERTIATLCRKVARRIATGEKGPFTITANNVQDFIGHPTYVSEETYRYDRPGVATGLAWTSVGGEVLFVEAREMPGKAPLTITGQIGKVMQESAMAALTFIRSNYKELGLSQDFFEGRELHVHVPAGAIPKDGPSAGITIATAMLSLFTGIRVKRTIAMTGEITLSGKVLPIGEVIVPKANESHLDDVPEEVRKKMKFYYASDLWDVLDVALEKPVRKVEKNVPAPRSAKKKKTKSARKGTAATVRKTGNNEPKPRPSASRGHSRTHPPVPG